MATTTLAQNNVTFFKAALSLGLISKTDAKRCLGAIERSGRDLDPGKVAIKLQLLTPEGVGDVRAKLLTMASTGSKIGSSVAAGPALPPAAPAPLPGPPAPLPGPPAPLPTSPAPPSPLPAAPAKPRSSTGRPRKSDAQRAGAPRKSPVSPLVLVGCALVAGTLTGVAAFVANQSPATAEVVTPTAVAPAIAPAPAVGLDTALALTVRSASELARNGNERAALSIIDEFVAVHGDSPSATSARARLLEQGERTLISATGRLRRQATEGVAVAAEVQRLRERLPGSFGARVDALALELRGLREKAAPVATPSEPAWEETSLLPDAPTGKVRLPDVTRPAPAAEEAAAEEPAAEEPAPAPPSTPRRADPQPTDDDEGEVAFTPPADDRAPQVDTDSPVALALRELLHVPYVLRDGKVDATYAFASAAEDSDFETAGFDKAEVNDVQSWGRGGIDLELGVGSQRMARLAHVLALAGDFQIDLTMWLNHSSGRSSLVFTLGNKIGVRWGQQIVKLSKSGGGRPLAGQEPDRTIFREERLVTVRITRVGDALTVMCNGRKVAEKTLKPGELDGRFGLIATDLRMIITDLRIQGVVDATKL
jgi:hypothetical protein